MINKVFGSQTFSTSGIKAEKDDVNIKDNQLDVKGNFNSLLSVYLI